MAIFISLSVCSQNKAEENKKSSKMEQFASQTGSIIKFLDYSLPNLKSMYGVAETKVRKIIAGESVAYFFQISKEGKYDTKKASIAYEDLLEVIKAISVLKTDSEIDILVVADYLENKFVTDDGFQIGYYVSDSKITWYIVLEKYGSGNTVFLKNLSEIEESFLNAKQKIDDLKQ